MKASVEFILVSVKQAREKLDSFTTLVNAHRAGCGMEVQGTFVDIDGNLAFLESGWYRIDPLTVSAFHMNVYVDGEWSSLKPADGDQFTVRLCFPRPESWDQTW